eukprot:jgi/Picre1/33164/NNA_008489.t1
MSQTETPTGADPLPPWRSTETKKREDTNRRRNLWLLLGQKREQTPRNKTARLAVENTQAENIKNDTSGKAPAEGTDATGNGAPVVGGAAILAKLRAARKHKSPKPHPVVVLYGSQTGTAAEVAKNISASIEGMGLTSRVVSMNEMGFGNLSKEKTPCVIWVASSTGDGEALIMRRNSTMMQKKESAEGCWWDSSSLAWVGRF